MFAKLMALVMLGMTALFVVVGAVIENETLYSDAAPVVFIVGAFFGAAATVIDVTTKEK